MSLRGMMFDRCNTFRLTMGKDRLAANFDDYQPLATNVRCNAQIQSAKQIVYYGQFGMQLDALFYFDSDPDLCVA